MVGVGDARRKVERAVEAGEGARETDEHFTERRVDLRDSHKGNKRHPKTTVSSQRHLCDGGERRLAVFDKDAHQSRMSD